MANDLKYGIVVVEHDSEEHPLNNKYGFSKDDEPVFIIRAQDKVALLALQYYADLIRMHRPELVKEVGTVYDTFRDWRERNPDRVKLPD